MKRATGAEAAAHAAEPSRVLWSTRVYYQHTDAGGVVFHSRYLDFMECARAELLQSLGFDIAQLARERHVLFMVYSAVLDYARPALLNDTIGVSARLAKVGRARLVFRQEVTRSGELLASGDITLACVDARTLRPLAVPAVIRECLEELADPPAAGPAGTPVAAGGQS